MNQPNMPNGINLNGKPDNAQPGGCGPFPDMVHSAMAPAAGPAPMPPSFEPTLADLANPQLAARLEPYRTAYLTTPPELRVDVVPGVAVCLARRATGAPYQLVTIDITRRDPVMSVLGLDVAAARKLRGALDLVL